VLILRRINCINTSSGIYHAGRWLIYITLVDDCLVCRSEGNSRLAYQTVIYQRDIYQTTYWYNWFAWWWALVCSKHVEKRNKYIEKSASSWLLTRIKSLITLWTVNNTVICFGIILRKQFEENAVVYCLMAYVCSVATPDLTRPVIPWNRFWDLKFGGITTSAIFTRFGTQRLSLLYGPKRRVTWTSNQIRRWGEKGGARVAVTATKRRLLPRSLYPPGTLEQVCRRRWELHWRLMSLYRIYFYCKSFHIFFPVFVRMTIVSINEGRAQFLKLLVTIA
jgi:hypothetical protein